MGHDLAGRFTGFDHVGCRGTAGGFLALLVCGPADLGDAHVFAAGPFTHLRDLLAAGATAGCVNGSILVTDGNYFQPGPGLDH